MQTIDFQGTKIAFYPSENPDGIPLVLLHGFCEDSRLWEDWLKLLSHLHVIRIDLPGFGGSGLPQNLSIESMADAVKAIADHLTLEKFVLCGHSMGGYVSLAFAEKYPERLAGLSLFHSHPFADSEEKKAGRLKSVGFIRKNGHVLFVKQLIPGLFANDNSLEVNRMIFNALQYRPEAIIAALGAMRQRPDRSGLLKNLACPVQFIIGKLDKVVPFKQSLAMSLLPSVADVQILPFAGHMGMMEEARETAKAVKNFTKMIEKKALGFV